MSLTSPILLTIAGSDSGAGAGVQADIKTACAHGVYAVSVLTNITAQNTVEVCSTFPVPADIIRQQFEAVMDDFEVDAIKIGLLGNVEVVEQVASCLSSLKTTPPVVLDPVFGSSSGSQFMGEEELAVLKEKLLPLCDVITPNIAEAENLSGLFIASREEMEHAARKCIESGFGRSVVITGGEGFEKTCVDLLLDDGETVWLEGERVETTNSHGTGCCFSSALASNLAKGRSLRKASAEAKGFVSKCLRESAGLKIGSGSGPLFQGFIK